jgi:hypothetical protein
MCTHLHWASARNKGPVKVLRQAQLLFNEQVPAGKYVIISLLVGRADTYIWGPHKANLINCIIRVRMREGTSKHTIATAAILQLTILGSYS